MAIAVLLMLRPRAAHAEPLAPEVFPADDWVLATDDAEPAPPEVKGFGFSERLATLNAMMGFGTPLGLLGGTLELNPASGLALGAGAGMNAEGLQLAVLARGRPLAWEREKRALALTLGVALATGPYRPFGFDPLFGSLDHSGMADQRVVHLYDRVHWLQPDAGFELQAKSGFHFVVSQGVALPLGYSGEHCELAVSGAAAACSSGPARGATKPDTLWTITVMVGHAL